MRFEGVLGPFSPLVVVGALALLSAASSSSCADTVTLKNGREIHGRLVKEELESVRIRTSGGTITIPKIEIATFTENQDFEAERARTKAQIAADEAREAKIATKARKAQAAAKVFPEKPKAGDGEAGDGKAGDGEAGDGEAGDGEAGEDAVWVWSEELSDEDIDELTPIRDRLQEELAAQGLTKEQRLERVKLTATEERDLNERVAALGRRTHRRQRANLQRANALKGIVANYGLKALKKLVAGLESRNQWVRRGCAKGIGELASAGEPGEAEWLLWSYDAPSKLAKLMDHQGEVDSPQIRKLANETLRLFVKKSFGFKASDSSISTPIESRAVRKWQAYCNAAAKAWTKGEEEKRLLREKLQEDLEKLKQGTKPDADAK